MAPAFLRAAPLALLALTATATATLGLAAEPAAGAAPAPAVAKPAPPNPPPGGWLLSDDPEKAFQELQAANRVPPSPAEWNKTPPTEEERKEFRKKLSVAAGLAADKAKEFHTRFPDHRNAAFARSVHRELLKAAVQLGAEDRKAQLEALGAESGEPVLQPAPGPFEKRMNEAMAKAMALQSQGMPAVLEAFEKGVREVQKEFPDRPEIYSALMEVAQNSGAEKKKALFQEILAAKVAPEELKQAVQAIQEQLDRVGKPFALAFTATDGSKVDIASLKGKVVLVDFWATWCGPCVREVPNVVAAYDRLHPKGLEILGISLDEDETEMKQFVKKNKMPWPQYFDGEGWKNKIAKPLGVNSIPAMWLVDKKGVLRDLEAREDLEKKVADLLAEK